MRILDDARHVAVAHRHDRRVAADEERATRLQRPLVGRIELHTREPHADDDVLPHADAAVDGHLVLLRDAVAKHVEHVAAVGDGGDLADADPLDLGVEHPLDRLEVARDERPVPPQQQIDGRLAHPSSLRMYRSGTGKAGASAPLSNAPSSLRMYRSGTGKAGASAPLQCSVEPTHLPLQT